MDAAPDTRLLVRIWEDYLRAHPGVDRLPPILPAVVYHGDSPWTHRVSLMELMEVDAAMSKLLTPHIPDFAFRLDDLSNAGAEELRARAMTAMAKLSLFCLARARKSGDVAVELEQWWQAQPERIEKLTKQLGPRAEEALMTGAEILRAEGEAKGEARGQAKTLLKLLDLKFGTPSEATVARVQSATISQLDAWVERVLSASSLDDVFKD